MKSIFYIFLTLMVFGWLVLLIQPGADEGQPVHVAAGAKEVPQPIAEQENPHQLIGSYRGVLNVVADWNELRWDARANLALAYGAVNNLSSGVDINACMSLLADDIRTKNEPFLLGINACVKRAKAGP